MFARPQHMKGESSVPQRQGTFIRTYPQPHYLFGLYLLAFQEISLPKFDVFLFPYPIYISGQL